jgi:hypothetical protein
MSDKAQWGYVAGIVDGEGTITICRSEYTANRKAENGRPARQYHTTGFSLKISVKNTDVRLVKWLKSRFGGEYYTDTGKKPANWKDSYVWHYGAETKQEFLLAILPYLIIKKEQALLALEFLRLGSVQTPEKRQALYEKIVALNQRGKLVETNTQDTSPDEVMIESVLTGDSKSAPTVT